MDPATITATIAAVASSIGLLVTSLRKRQDTTYEELQSAKRELQNEKRDLQADKDNLEKELDREKQRRADVVEELRTEQDHNLRKDRTIATLRRVLAINEIADPTITAGDTSAGS